MAKFYYFDRETNNCEAEIACSVPIDDTSRGNRFLSKVSCLRLCKEDITNKSETKMDDCFLPLDAGGNNCSPRPQLFSQRYFYDPDLTKCRTFNYSGCVDGGNNNNFPDMETCLTKCAHADQYTAAGPGPKDKCRMAKDSGTCRLMTKRYFFNVETDKCQPFTYGGCKGNLNNFATMEDCEDECQKNDDVITTSHGYVVTEVVIGVIGILLVILGLVLGVKYFKIWKANENYRIFTGLQRTSSISSVAATLPASSTAYENPAYAAATTDEENRNSFQMNENRPPITE